MENEIQNLEANIIKEENSLREANQTKNYFTQINKSSIREENSPLKEEYLFNLEALINGK